MSIKSNKNPIKCLILILSIFPIICHGQAPAMESMNYAPKTPEAAAFLKYGEYPVDLSTGLPNISIPLYTITDGDFSIPISLDYHASGIKVAQEATWVGLGWNLNAGAQIILSVRGGVDENSPHNGTVPNENDIFDYWTNNPYNFNGPANVFLEEPRVKDSYYFSSPTVNGNFYIRDEASNDVVVYPPDSFTVDLNAGGQGNPIKFKVTDKAGNSYLFKAIKEISAVSMTHSDYYDSAWYVSEIKTPKNGSILFTYQSDGTLSEVSRFQSVSLTDKGETKDMGSEDSACSMIFTHPVGSVVNQTSITSTSAMKLKEIIFNNGNSRVLFTKANDRQDLQNSSNGYLKFIQIQSKNPATSVYTDRKNFELTYSYFEPQTGSNLNTKRLRLDKITDMIDGLSATTFTYSDKMLPGKDSNSIDYFGYYNHASNQNLIPVHQVGAPYNVNVGSANRSVNPGYTDSCMLTEIHYPTKGKTKFSYEPNDYYKGMQTITHDNLIWQGELYGTAPSASANPPIGPPTPDGYAPSCTAPNPVNCVQYKEMTLDHSGSQGQVTFKIENSDNPNDPTANNHCYARVRIFAGASSYDSGIQKFTQSTVTIPLVSVSGTLLLEAYGAQMSIKNVNVKYFTTETVPINEYTGGLRIKSIESFDKDSDTMPKLRKVYDYKNISDASRSSGELVNTFYSSPYSFTTPIFSNYIFHICPQGCTFCAALSYTKTYSIQSNSTSGLESNTVIYRSVKETLLDANDNENGYTLYEFNIAADEVPFGNLQIPTTWKRGKLLEKKDYLKTSIGHLIIRKEKNTYVEDNRKIAHIQGYMGYKHSEVPENALGTDIQNTTLQFQLFNSAYGLPSRARDAYEIHTYDIPVPWYYQESSEVTDYFYDSANALSGSLVQTTHFYYDNPEHLQLTRTETTNSKNQTITTKKYYPDDLITEPLMADLKQQHRIGEVIRTETYNQSNRQFYQGKTYKDWGNNLFMPESVQTAKGNTLPETRQRFNLLDTNGNPLEVQQESGVKTCYIWGYNKSVPVAKIENIDYTNIPATLITDIQTASDIPNNEANVLLKLNALRNNSALATAMVTTITYIPLVGVSTITDPKGDKMTYSYDILGRLVSVKDKDGNILAENDYHYRTQN